MRSNRNVLSLIAGIIGSLYLIFIVCCMFGGMGSISVEGTASQLGYVFGAAMLVPTVVCTAVAVLLNWLGYGMNSSGCTLAAGIVYTAAIIVMPIYFMFLVAEAVLCYIAFAQVKHTVPDAF